MPAESHKYDSVGFFIKPLSNEVKEVITERIDVLFFQSLSTS
jgi:hypothetical protein